jgi:hypothetical protein
MTQEMDGVCPDRAGGKGREGIVMTASCQKKTVQHGWQGFFAPVWANQVGCRAD